MRMVDGNDWQKWVLSVYLCALCGGGFFHRSPLVS